MVSFRVCGVSKVLIGWRGVSFINDCFQSYNNQNKKQDLLFFPVRIVEEEFVYLDVSCNMTLKLHTSFFNEAFLYVLLKRLSSCLEKCAR